jgi:hypothetical protein
MPYIHVRANRVMPRIDHGKNQIAARSLHAENHLRRGEHTRAIRAQKSDRVIVPDFNNFFAFRPNPIVSHRYGHDSPTAGKESSIGPRVAR